MTSKDYMNLYYFCKANNKKIIDFKTWKPQLKDIENYNKVEKRFDEVWKKDKSLIHKNIALREATEEIKQDNNFQGCMEIGHKWEIQIEQEFKKYGVDIGMYYDNRQFKGENEFGIEIKHDGKIGKYGNIYIEYLALNRNETEFIPGGIAKKDNSKYWLIGNEINGYYIFYKDTLYDIYQKMVINNEKVDRCYLKERRTSKAIAIRIDKARELMISDNIGEFLVKIGRIE